MCRQNLNLRMNCEDGSTKRKRGEGRGCREGVGEGGGEKEERRREGGVGGGGGGEGVSDLPSFHSGSYCCWSGAGEEHPSDVPGQV